MIVEMKSEKHVIFSRSIEVSDSAGQRYLITDAGEEGLIIAVVTEPSSSIAVRPQSGNAVRVRGEEDA